MRTERFKAMTESVASMTEALLDVATSTAFRLRHRFLTAVVGHQPSQVSGLLEADETYFRESQKGVRGLRRKARARGGKAEATKSEKDLVPVLVGQVRGTRQVTDRVLTAMTADQGGGCPPLRPSASYSSRPDRSP